MSLTSRLKSNQNPTRLYFEENFPAKKNFTQEWKRRTKDLPSILPQDPSSLYPWSLVGHAIDYRIRLFFKKYSISDTVAKNGFLLIFSSESEINEADLIKQQQTKHLLLELEEEFENITKEIVGKLKSSDIERRIAKCCLVLSYAETQVRSNRPSEPLLHTNTLEDLFSEMSETVIDDLVTSSIPF
jgi:hypothetical protein